ncbi:MAG: tyrosine-type recombinase/integrase [Elusimicrobia bacterium]|nr:tyrosine-type recombinase/integrase [Elusimicrobiota bacterium]
MAAHIGASLRTVRNLIKAGDIPYDVVPGGRKRRMLRFKASLVDDWLFSVEGGSRKKYNGHHMGLYRYRTGKNKSDIWQYWYAIDGQRIYGTTGTADYVKAKEVYIQTYNSALEGRREPKGRVTVGQAIVDYLIWSKVENKPSTYTDKVNRSHTILRHFDKNRRLASLNVEDIERYKLARKSQKAKRRKTPPTGATINRELTFLQGLLTWAKAWGKIASSPFDTGSIKKFKEIASEGKYLNDDQKQRLIAACSDKFRPVVVAVLNTGMRLGEVKTLEWKHVNLSLRVLHLIDTKSRNRTVMMGPGLVEMFKRMPKRSEHVFTHEDGRPLSTSYIEEEFARTCLRAGIMNFTFHDLRDVFATDFYKQTKDIRKLQRVIGHSSIATTERYLATLGLDDSKEVDAISDTVFTESVRNSLGMGSGAAGGV